MSFSHIRARKPENALSHKVTLSDSGSQSMPLLPKQDPSAVPRIVWGLKNLQHASLNTENLFSGGSDPTAPTWVQAWKGFKNNLSPAKYPQKNTRDPHSFLKAPSFLSCSPLFSEISPFFKPLSAPLFLVPWPTIPLATCPCMLIFKAWRGPPLPFQKNSSPRVISTKGSTHYLIWRFIINLANFIK